MALIANSYIPECLNVLHSHGPIIVRLRQHSLQIWPLPLPWRVLFYVQKVERSIYMFRRKNLIILRLVHNFSEFLNVLYLLFTEKLYQIQTILQLKILHNFYIYQVNPTLCKLQIFMLLCTVLIYLWQFSPHLPKYLGIYSWIFKKIYFYSYLNQCDSLHPGNSGNICVIAESRS